MNVRSKLVVFLVLLAALPLVAQSDRGQINGTVTDSAGAVVSDAKVTAEDLNTSEVHETRTTAQGAFTIPELKADPYKVVVERTGFKTATFNNVVVAVQVTRTVNVQLQVGQISEQVTVTSAVPVIQTESAVIQTNVTEKQVKELPLAVNAESGGRTPLAFIFLDSSVTSANTSQQGRGTDASQFHVAGNQAGNTDILIDGAGTRRAQNGTFFSEVAPGPNAYQEFTLSTSSYSAEYGAAGGGVVNFTIKSGTNKLHGEGYELFRNEWLEANSYVHNAATPKIPRDRDRQNDFGFNIGGPIVIPHIYNGHDKAFWFFNYEGYRFSQGETVDISVPTLKMRTGDFSELLTDPYVLQFFGGPVQIYDPTVAPPGRPAIPGNRLDLYSNAGTGKTVIDPAGLAILQNWPKPTKDGVFHNFHANTVNPTNMNNYVAKGDYAISDRQHLSASYSLRNLHSFKPTGQFPRFPIPYTANGVWEQFFKSHYARLQDDLTLSNTLLNHLNIGFTRVDVANHNTSVPFQTSSLGIPALATQNIGFPRIGFPGYGDVVTGNDPRAYQEVGSTFFSDHQTDNALEISDVVTWVKGKHTFKFGFDDRMTRFNVTQFIDPGGSFNFRGDQTALNDPGHQGWPIASLITGATEFSFDTIHSVSPAYRYVYPSFFANDDYKVTQKLSLNLGVRYELPFPRTEAHNYLRGFDPKVMNPAVKLPGALVGAGGQGGLKASNAGLVSPYYGNFGPRLGFAYSPFAKIVVRGGYGIYYAPIQYNGNILGGTQGYSTAQLLTPNGLQSTAFLSTYPAAPAVNPNGQFIGSDVEFYNTHFRPGLVQQYTLDMQYEIAPNLAFDLAYLGHVGQRLTSNFLRVNALPLNDLKLGDALLRKNLSSVTASDRAYASSVGVTIPSSGFFADSSSGASVPFDGTVAQALRPFPQYGNINSQLESLGRDYYNALQAKLERRFANGIQFGASYTWSHEITNASESITGGGSPLDGTLQNPFNPRSVRATDPNDITHVLVLNFLLELPFGRNHRYLNRGGAVDRILGGWQLGGITRYQSGVPLVVSDAGDGYGDFLNLVGYQGGIRPNLVPGQAILLGVPSSTLSYQAVNPAAFSLPPVYGAAPGGAAIGSAAYAAYYADPMKFFGTAPAVLTNARTQPFYREDINLLKKTAITETTALEFRIEAFNLLNRHRFFQPNGDLNAGPNFGVSNVVNDTTVFAPRTLQLGLRFIF